jgi:CBS domain-containing protein
MTLPQAHAQFLASVHPYSSMSDAALSALSKSCSSEPHPAGARIFGTGDPVTALYLIVSGEIEITDPNGEIISTLGPRNSFGERALLRSERASRTATVTSDAVLIVLPAVEFHRLFKTDLKFQQFFDRSRSQPKQRRDLTTLNVGQLMTRDPVTCSPDTPIKDAALMMHERRISSICVVEGSDFKGIVTIRDIAGRVVGQGRDPALPVSQIMTTGLLTLGPHALGTDVLHLMMERSIGHIPIVDGDRLIGIVTQTDLTRAQAMTSADLVGRIAQAMSAQDMAKVTREIPDLLVQLVEQGNRHEVITRLITDLADTATRRLLTLAHAEIGPAPVAYLWLACGSQGRQEQTGVSDQDNCLILSDDTTEGDLTYFAELAKFVSDGLATCGYFYCPGDMMATNPRWCQPLSVWKDYFARWIAKPDPEAQMLASVMFDLRPIGGDETLFDDLQAETLGRAAKNSIFVAHMVSNSLKHTPPLGLLRGLATIRSGEHRNELDLKHNGVVPVVDLGRIYTLQGQLKPVNTRARLEAAIDAGILSATGGADLLDAYDLIATTRLEHQVAQVKAGKKPDNFLNPSDLSDFERSHLRNAFVVVKTLQSAIGSGKGMLG